MRTQLKKDEKIILVTQLHWYPALFNPVAFAILCFGLGIWLGAEVGSVSV
jgi:hypothetical protein